MQIPARTGLPPPWVPARRFHEGRRRPSGTQAAGTIFVNASSPNHAFDKGLVSVVGLSVGCCMTPPLCPETRKHLLQRDWSPL